LSFLQGLTKGRILKYAQQEQKRTQTLATLGQFAQMAMQTPGLTDDAQAKIRQSFLPLLGNSVLEQLGDATKGAKKGEEGTGHKIAGMAKNAIEAISGGQLKGEKLDVDKIGSFMSTIQDTLKDPASKTETHVTAAQGAMEEARQKLKEKLGRDPLQEELSNDQAFRTASQKLTGAIGLKATDEYTKSLLGSLQKEAPRKEPTEAQQKQAEAAARLGIPPGTASTDPPSLITQPPPGTTPKIPSKAALSALAGTTPPPGTAPAAPIKITDQQIDDLRTVNKNWVKDIDKAYVDGKEQPVTEIRPGNGKFPAGFIDHDGNYIPKERVSMSAPKELTPREQLEQDLVDSGKAKDKADAKKQAAEMNVTAAKKKEDSVDTGAMRTQEEIVKGAHPEWDEAKVKAEAANTLQRFQSLKLTKQQQDLAQEESLSRAMDGSTSYAPGGPSKANPSGEGSIEIGAWNVLISPDGKSHISGMGKETQALNKRAMDRAGEIMKEWGVDYSNIEQLRSAVKANGSAFSAVTKMGAMIHQFEGTANRNMQTAAELSQKWDRTNIPFANRVAAAYKTGTGDSEALNFVAQMHGLAAEWTKIMAGSTGASGATVSGTKDAEEIMKPYLSQGQIDSLFGLIQKDFTNRNSAIQDEKANLMKSLSGASVMGVAGGTQPGSAKTQPPPGTVDPSDPEGLFK
jgi:hypothetical protein